MKRQKGATTTIFVAVLALAAAGAAGYYAWQQKLESERRSLALDEARAQLAAASAEARQARDDATAARKALEQQKAELEQLRAERDSARAFLESEKAHGARVQAELVLAQQQLAYLRSRGAGSANTVQPALLPMPVEVRPTIIRAIPGSSARAVSRSAPAPAMAVPR